LATRDNTALLCDLGNALINVCTVVPNGKLFVCDCDIRFCVVLIEQARIVGVVVFFTSYAFEAHVHKVWQANGISARLSARKPIHREKSSTSNNTNNNNNNNNNNKKSTSREEEDVLMRYSRDARSERGALLCAVMGGRLSEGINFADGLARAVVVVGVPYAPINDPLLAERARRTHAAQLAARAHHSTTTTTTTTTLAATRRALYDDTAMKSVNQSIGRALRHRGDHAAILLCDVRYRRAPLRSRLPAWLRRSLAPPAPTYGAFVRRLAQFSARFKQPSPQQPPPPPPPQ
jgi:chromosome transmission fidelity protein 1